jgi:hypothetical protein
MWYEDKSHPYPSCFSARTLTQLPEKMKHEDGSIIYRWNSIDYSEEEWRNKWNDEHFPKLKKEIYMHETVNERTYRTKRHYDDVWIKASSLTYPSSMTGSARSFLDNFKLDVSDNICYISHNFFTVYL